MYVCARVFNKKERETERGTDRKQVCVYAGLRTVAVKLHTGLPRVCAFMWCAHRFIRTCRDGHSDRFRELTHKSAHLHWVRKNQQHKDLIV